MKCSTVSDGPEVSATGAEVLVVLGQRAKLGCSVTGFPAPQVTWYKDGQGRSIVVFPEKKIFCPVSLSLESCNLNQPFIVSSQS